MSWKIQKVALEIIFGKRFLVKIQQKFDSIMRIFYKIDFGIEGKYQMRVEKNSKKYLNLKRRKII